MRAKYKLGSLVQFNSGAGTEHGIVTGVMTRENSYSYELEGHDSLILEDDVTGGFRPIAARKVAPKKVAKKASKKPVLAEE